MPIPKKYFHDRLVVLLLGLNVFLGVLGALLVLLRIDTSRSGGYIIEYRANFGVGEFKPGGGLSVATFALFLVVNVVVAIILSIRTYNLRRYVSLMMLGLGLVLSLLAIIVSNALLVLR